jgi:DNA polymerase V
VLLAKKTKDIVLLKEAVSTYAARCGEKLRKQNSIANLLTVFIHTDPFNTNERQYNKSKLITLPVPTNNNTELIKYALFCLSEIYNPEYIYKKAGVIVDGLESQFEYQSNIFDNLNRNKQQELGLTIDQINQSHGRDKIKVAVQGSGNEWKLKQEKLSKKYTTNWDNIIEVIL